MPDVPDRNRLKLQLQRHQLLQLRVMMRIGPGFLSGIFLQIAIGIGVLTSNRGSWQGHFSLH